MVNIVQFTTFTVLFLLPGVFTQGNIPPGAQAVGATQVLFNYAPVASDIATLGSNGPSKLYSGQWYENQPALSHYSTHNGTLAISLGGDLVSYPRDFSTKGLIPALSGSNPFYIDFETWLSDNNMDHWPAVWLMPIQHNGMKWDHYPGDPSEYERWMELDVDEGGFGHGLTTTVHSWTGIYPNYGNEQNPNNVLSSSLDRTVNHTIGANYNPTTNTVTWWLDGKQVNSASSPYVPAIASKQNFYFILSCQTHGGNIPYIMYVRRVRGYVKP